MFFGKKDLKKDNSPKCKINTLAHYMSFGPIRLYLGYVGLYIGCDIVL